MDEIYKELGFKQPDILVNKYGIKIYVGTKGDADWCIVIPKELCKVKSASFDYEHDMAFYLLAEEDVLDMAKQFTEIARRREKGEKK